MARILESLVILYKTASTCLSYITADLARLLLNRDWQHMTRPSHVSGTNDGGLRPSLLSRRTYTPLSLSLFRKYYHNYIVEWCNGSMPGS